MLFTGQTADSIGEIVLANSMQFGILCVLMKPVVRKRDSEKVVRTTISIPPKLLQDFRIIEARDGYTGLSDYLQSSIRRDRDLKLVPQ